MAAEIQTRTGRCSTHGTVDATRNLPQIRFPYIIYAVLRSVAKRRPFRCPTCQAPVDTH
jgi:hypothetical protein